MRLLARLLWLPVAALSLAFFLFVVTAPASVSGVGYASSIVLLVMAGTARRARARRRIALAGVVLLTSTVILRVALVGHGRHLRMSTPTGEGARWVDRLLDEQDLAVNAARALAWTGFLHDPDVPQLAHVMRGAYARMHDAEGATPSPVAATYMGLEAPGSDHTLEMGDIEASAGVVVFLHGYAGSFTLPCWVVSQAASRAGFATVCPATRWLGDWWSSEGAATLRETLQSLRRRGVRKVVLAGLSNGGIGASLLASRLRGQVDGLIVISGASPDAVPPSVPVLAIQGEHDAQIPETIVRAYAARVGGRYVSLDAGHFAMLVREDETSAAITSFLRTRVGTQPASEAARSTPRTTARETPP